jgi:hypothetical protein
MSTTILVLSSLGGVLAFAGVIFTIIRTVFKEVGAIEDNTKATQANTLKLTEMTEKINGHDTRIAVLEDRMRRGNPEST